MDRIDALEEKVAQLQRENRWYRLGGVVAVLALAGVLLLGMGETTSMPADAAFRNVTASSLAIVDGDGKHAVYIAGIGTAGMIQIYGGKGHIAASIDANHYDAGDLALFDNKGNVRCHITSWQNGFFLSGRNKKNKEIINLRADEYGNGVVSALRPGP